MQERDEMKGEKSKPDAENLNEPSDLNNLNEPSEVKNLNEPCDSIYLNELSEPDQSKVQENTVQEVASVKLNSENFFFVAEDEGDAEKNEMQVKEE